MRDRPWLRPAPEVGPSAGSLEFGKTMKIVRQTTLGSALLLLACGETTVVMPPVSEPVEAPRPSRATTAAPPRPSGTAIASATPAVAASPPPAPPPPPGEAISESDVEDFVLDDAGIFVVGKTSVRLVPKGGGKTRALATGLRSPRGIAVDGTRVYWADEGTARGRYADGAIMSLSKGGGAPVVVAVQQRPSGIIVDDTTLYWMSRDIINSCQKQACRPSAAVTGASDRVGFLIDDAYLYWVSKDRVLRTPKAGGPPTQLGQSTISSASPSDGIDGMAIDDSFVYVFGSDVIERIPKTGGPPHRVVDDVY